MTQIYNKHIQFMIPSFVKKFYQKHNLRAVECTWLLYVHVLGFVGLLITIFNYDNFLKIFLMHCVFHLFYGLGITAGCHRLWSHKSYHASLPLRILLMLFNCGANQGSIFHWSRDHRLHHKFSDTPLDPHNINQGFFFSHVGWLLLKKTPQLVQEGKKIDLTDLKNDKVVSFQKKHYLPLSILMCFIIPTISYSFFLDFPIYQCFPLSMLTYCITLNSTWCVNSVCHMFGSRPWNNKIEPTDNYFVSLITHGEGYHNWHHEYPSDWRASKDEWYMFNITARFIEIASILGFASLKI